MNQRLFLLLLVTFLISNKLYCQNIGNEFRIENLQENEEFEVKDSLYSWNGVEPTKKAKRRFNELLSCGVDVNYRTYKMDSLPDVVEAFSYSFYLENETAYSKTYKSKEVDSEIHFITFNYNNYSDLSLLDKIQIESMNVRSGEVYGKYIYRFWDRR